MNKFINLILALVYFLPLGSQHACAMDNAEFQAQLLLRKIENTFPFTGSDTLRPSVRDFLIYVTPTADLSKYTPNAFEARIRMALAEANRALEKRAQLSPAAVRELENSLVAAGAPKSSASEARLFSEAARPVLHDKNLEIDLSARLHNLGGKIDLQNQLLLRQIENVFPIERSENLQQIVRDFWIEKDFILLKALTNKAFNLTIQSYLNKVKEALQKRALLSSEELADLDVWLERSHAPRRQLSEVLKNLPGVYKSVDSRLEQLKRLSFSQAFLQRRKLLRRIQSTFPFYSKSEAPESVRNFLTRVLLTNAPGELAPAQKEKFESQFRITLNEVNEALKERSIEAEQHQQLVECIEQNAVNAEGVHLDRDVSGIIATYVTGITQKEANTQKRNGPASK